MTIEATGMAQQVWLDDDFPFCFWDVKSVQDVYFISFNMVIILIIMATTLLRIVKSFQTFQFIKRQIKVIYSLVTLWGVVFMAQYIYALYIFFSHLNGFDHPKDIPQYSRVYSLFDAIPGYTIQTIFYYIWVLIFSNLRQIILYLELPLSKFQKIGYPIIMVYFYARFAIKIASWVMALFCSLDQLWLYNTINIIVLLTDAMILNIALIVSFPIFLRRINFIKLQNSGAQKRKLKKQYIFMIVSSSLRFALDLQVLIIQPFTKVRQSSCINSFQDHLQFSLQYLFFDTAIVQFIPIIVILKFYHLKQQDRQILQKKYNQEHSRNLLRDSQSIGSIQRSLSPF